jgi:hypothetical protein
VPQRAIWEDTDSIAEILNYLGSVDGLNHMFLPDGGGMDLRGARQGLEPGTIELIIDDGVVYVVKPKRLIFESFDFSWEWNYFRLETGGLAVTGIVEVYLNRERLFEIAPLQYISEADRERDWEGERKYPSGPRHVDRFINGDFLVVGKASSYNQIPSTYDGRHSQMGTDEFRDYISQKVQLVRQMLRDEKVAKLASEKGLTIDDVVFAYLDKVFSRESRWMERYLKEVSVRESVNGKQ